MSPQQQTVEIPKRWPLVNNANSRDGTFLKDARLVNAYAEKDVTTGEYEINKRFGVAPINIFSSGAGVGRGLFTWENLQIGGPRQGFNTYLTWVVGVQLYVSVSPIYLVVLNPGSVGSISGKVSFLQVPNQTTPRILISGAVPTNIIAGYYMGTDLVLHSAVNFPANTVYGLAYLDGTCYVMDVFGAIWNSDNLNDPTTWTAGNHINAISEADYGVFLAKQTTYIVAVKQYSTLFFYDAGNPTGSPLAPVPGAMFNFGCLSADTFQTIDGVLFWVTLSQAQPSQVIMVANLQHSSISTPAVERMLDLSGLSVFYSFSFKRSGHKFYGITNVSSNVTLVYDIGEKLWYVWSDAQGNYYPVVAQTTDTFGRLLFQYGSDGRVVQADSDYIYPNDQGEIVPVDVYTPNFDAGVDRRKQLNVMRFNADQTPGSELLVRSSNDDYQTWTNFRRVDLSNRRPTLTNCGSFYRRAYHFRHYANTALRIKSVDLQMDLGTL